MRSALGATPKDANIGEDINDDAPPHSTLCIVDHCSKREDSDGTCADSDEDHEDLAGRREDLAGRCTDSDEEHEELNDEHQGSDD